MVQVHFFLSWHSVWNMKNIVNVDVTRITTIITVLPLPPLPIPTLRSTSGPGSGETSKHLDVRLPNLPHPHKTSLSSVTQTYFSMPFSNLGLLRLLCVSPLITLYFIFKCFLLNKIFTIKLDFNSKACGQYTWTLKTFS